MNVKQPYEKMSNLYEHCDNPVKYNFKNEITGEYYKKINNSNTSEIKKVLLLHNENFSNKTVDMDRCILALDYYELMYNVKCDTDFAGNHEWSYDTINSFQTTFQCAIKIYCDDLYNDSREFKSIEHIKRGKISAKWLEKNYYDLLKYTSYKEVNNLKYLQHFAYWYHTIGNFTLIPFYFKNAKGYITPLNNHRGTYSKIKDYFDLSLNVIEDGFNFMNFISKYPETNSEKLDFYNYYIKKFHLNEYYEDNKPIMFYENHRCDSPLPESKEDLKKLILEMIIRIIKRGVAIFKTYESICENKEIEIKSKYEECCYILERYKTCKIMKSCDKCNKSTCIIAGIID